MKSIRKIIKITEELCNGCGGCVHGCMEGALAVIYGKAMLVKDSYCDGEGVCLDLCPNGALAIVEREAEDFDEAAALSYMASQGNAALSGQYQYVHTLSDLMKPSARGYRSGTVFMAPRQCKSAPEAQNAFPQALSQTLSQTLGRPLENAIADFSGTIPGHWPLKMRLVPAGAPFFKNADILMAADCAAATSAAFHSSYAPGKVLLIGCPKLDNSDDYLPKMTEILRKSGPRSCTVLRMELPCCRGFSLVLNEAARLSDSPAPIRHIILSRSGHEIVTA